MLEEQKEEKYDIYTEEEDISGEEEESGFSFREFCQEAVSLLISAYLFIVFCLYPFYLKDGYTDVGKEKFNFYKVMTIGGFGLIVPLALFCIFFRIRDVYRKREGMKDATRGFRFSVTDCAVAAYGISVFLSYLGSEFKQMALWGEKGWNMGLLTQMLFVLSYFLVAHFWEFEEKLLLAFMAAATIVFLLGVLNRFSVFPIKIQGANNGFLSTLGNINWYCGFWSVLFPVGFILYWCGEEIWLRLSGFLCTAVGIATGVSQGSNSAFIAFTGLYLFVFCLSFRSLARMKRFLELAILFCATCQSLRFWRFLQPDAFDYYDGTISDWITLSRATLFLFIALCVIYFLLCLMGRKKNADIRNYKMVRQITILTVAVIVGVYIFLLILNTRIEGGIRFMGKLSPLVFSEQWGSARGATWSAGIEIYRNMHGWKKLIGVGPDCFAMYLYTLPDLAKWVIKQFDGARLTNAHNEWLTVLVNQGILGFISYGSIFISAVIRYVSCAEKGWEGRKKYLYIFGLSAFTYAIHNIVSFQQILSTPFIFLMIGMGEALRKEQEKIPVKL